MTLVGTVPLSRRALLVSSAAAFGCGGAKKAIPYSGYCFVANQGSRTVAVVDLLTFRRLPAIALPETPSAVIAHPSQPKSFVLAPQAGTVFELDAAKLAVSRRVHAGGEAVSMKLAPDGKALWVLCRNPGALVEIPLDSLAPRRRIAIPDHAIDFDLSIVRPWRAAIAAGPARLITLASLDTLAVERTVSMAVEPSGVCFQSDGKQVISVSNADRSVTLFEAATGKTVARLPLPFAPRRYCLSADGGQLFLTGDGMDAVTIVYPYQSEIAETVLAGRTPGAMAATGSPPGAAASDIPNYLFVTNPASNTITVLNIDDRRLVAVVQVGQEPREILISPDAQYALVLNEGSGDLAVIRLYALTEPRAHRYKSASLFTLIPVGDRPVSAAVVTL